MRINAFAASACFVYTCCACASAVSAATSSEPAGAIVWRLQQNTVGEFGLSLTQAPVFAGLVKTVTAEALTVAVPAWTPDQFTGPAQPFMVRITSGAQDGRLLAVTGNAEGTVIVQIGDTPLNASGFGVVAGDRFEIFPIHTLATLFGDSPASLQLLGGASAASADLVELYGVHGWQGFFFNTSVAPARWVSAANPVDNQNDLALLPNRGLRITRRGPTIDWVASGRVPLTRALTQLPGNATTSYANPFPVNATLGTFKLEGPGVWERAATAAGADTISLWDGVKTTVYFQRTDSQWWAADIPNVDQRNTAISAQGSVLITNLHAAVGRSAFFSQGLPYPSLLAPVPRPSSPPPAPPPPPPPAPSEPPTIRLSVRSRITTTKAQMAVRGRAASAFSKIAYVEYRIGSKGYRKAAGTEHWSFKMKLKEGATVAYVRAVDVGGLKSKTVKIVIKRK